MGVDTWDFWTVVFGAYAAALLFKVAFREEASIWDTLFYGFVGAFDIALVASKVVGALAK